MQIGNNLFETISEKKIEYMRERENPPMEAHAHTYRHRRRRSASKQKKIIHFSHL
jgi:hypothetical protein